MTRVTLLVAVSSSLASAPGPAAQDTVSIRGHGCEQCGVGRTKVVTLRMPPSASAFVLPNAFATAADGSHVLSDGFGDRTVHRFHPDGRYIGTIGRTGNGPGEYGLVRALTTDGDTLRVFSARQAIFSLKGVLIEDKALGMGLQVNAAVVVGDALVVNGTDPAPDRFGSWLHRLHPDGSIASSFDVTPARVPIVSPFHGLRSLTRGADASTLWAARYNRYEVTHWTTAGRLLRTVLRDVEWFRPWERWDGRVALGPSVPRLTSVFVDSAGLLWTLVRVPDRTWKATPRDSRMPSPSKWDSIDDTIVEVLDLERGVVIAHQRWPEAMDRFDALGRAIQLAELDDGEVVVNVWRLTFSRRKR